MLCRYQCVDCGEWHPLADIPTNELLGAMIAFTCDPPPPFSAKVWQLLINLEIQRRGGRRIVFIL